VVELRDVVFVEPLSVAEGSSAELRVVFEIALDGLEFKVVSITGGVRRTHAQGGANWIEPGPPARVDIEEIRRRCSIAVRDARNIFVSESGILSFGPHWGSARTVYEGQQEALTLLDATDAAAADRASWGFSPSLLDESTGIGRGYGGQQVLPLGYGRIVIRGPLPTRFYSHQRYHDTGSNGVHLRDLWLYDESGTELIAISEFTLRNIDADAFTTKFTAAPATGGAAAGELLADATTGDGISPADGAEAFRRLVGSRLGGQVAISPAAVAEVIASRKAFTQEVIEEELEAAVSSHQAERSADDGYVAPRTELEATLARIWGEGLGIAQVGMTDDFFEIGGDSLTAVQLLAMVQSELGVRLPMRSIFEDPTLAGAVRQIAQIRAAASNPADPANAPGLPTAGDGGSGAPASSTIPRLQRQPERALAQPSGSEPS
jgi:acyl carrier protein